jgi:hypothetical protein
MLDLEAIRQFAAHLPVGSKILDAGRVMPHDLEYLQHLGFSAEGFTKEEKDFRMLNLPKETYDGVWANQSLTGLPNEGCQRVMQNFFSTLKSGGTLFVAVKGHKADDFASLIRQNGFQILSHGSRVDAPEVLGFIARRL